MNDLTAAIVYVMVNRVQRVHLTAARRIVGHKDYTNERAFHAFVKRLIELNIERGETLEEAWKIVLVHVQNYCAKIVTDHYQQHVEYTKSIWGEYRRGLERAPQLGAVSLSHIRRMFEEANLFYLRREEAFAEFADLDKFLSDYSSSVVELGEKLVQVGDTLRNLRAQKNSKLSLDISQHQAWIALAALILSALNSCGVVGLMNAAAKAERAQVEVSETIVGEESR